MRQLPFVAAIGLGASLLTASPQPNAPKRVTWDDVAPFGSQLEARGITASGFDAYDPNPGNRHTDKVKVSKFVVS